MSCKHQFHTIKQIDKKPEDAPIMSTAYIYGVLVACSLCGEIRLAWETGEIEIKPKAWNNNKEKQKKESKQQTKP